MILTALHELAEREGLVAKPHFEERPVSYLLVVNEGGRLLTFHAVAESAAGIQRAARHYVLVPRPLPGARTTSTKKDPRFLVDNASFVLGIDAPGDKEKKNSNQK